MDSSETIKGTTHELIRVVDQPKRRIRLSGPGGGSEPAASRDREGDAAAPPTLLLNAIYDAIIIIDDHGQILEVNARAEEKFGHPRAHLLTTNILGLIEHSDNRLFEVLRRNVDARKYTVLDALCRGHGDQLFPAEVVVGADRHPATGGLCVFIRDIGARKKAEVMLHSVNTAVRNASNGIAITDLNWHVQYANPALVAQWGYAAEDDILDRDISEWLQPPDEVRTALSDQAAALFDAQIANRQGAKLCLQACASPNIDLDGRLIGYVLSLADITERYAADEANRHAAEQKHELEQIRLRLGAIESVGLSINNPLQALLSKAELDGRDDYKELVTRVTTIMQDLVRKESHKAKKLTQHLDDAGPDLDLDLPVDLKPFTPRSLLIVDDEAAIRHVFARMLTDAFAGARIEQAANGVDAIALVEALHPAVMVVDIAMPEMDGEALFAKVQALCAERGWELPHFVFCTGFIPSGTLAKIVDKGQTHVLIHKPVSRAAMIQAVGRFIPAAAPATPA